MKTAKSVTIQNREVTFQLTSVPIAMCAVIFVCAALYLQNNTFTSVSSEHAACTAQSRDTQCAAPADAILYGFTSRKLP